MAITSSIASATARTATGATTRATIALATVALAGCPLGATTTLTTTTTRSATASAGAGASSGDRPGAGATASSADRPGTGASGSPRLVVPNLIGKTRDEARALVKAAGFAGEPEDTRPLECVDAARDPGKINCQDPDAGQVVERYRMITIRVYQPTVIKGAIVRSQLLTLRGLTPDDAKVQLRKLGHDGEVRIGTVTDYGGGKTFDKDCGVNKVCYTSGESGIGIHDAVTLFINPVLKVAAPPE
jgi:PASTA domain